MAMRVAVSTDGSEVSGHFGRCPSFTIAEIEEGKVLRSEVIENPGHHPGFLPKFLSERGVRCIIAGGMGARAQGLFDECGIRTVLGVQGSVQEALAAFAGGRLTAGPSLCKPGAGKGYGVEKSVCDHGDGHDHEEAR
ncbi:MAG: NifB/NifX family molybdenum-iron cluster-binding protein [Elusimicrobiota bacterium]